MFVHELRVLVFFFAHILYLAYKLPENVFALHSGLQKFMQLTFFFLYIDLNSNQRKIKGLVTKRFDTEKKAAI